MLTWQDSGLQHQAIAGLLGESRSPFRGRVRRPDAERHIMSVTVSKKSSQLCTNLSQVSCFGKRFSRRIQVTYQADICETCFTGSTKLLLNFCCCITSIVGLRKDKAIQLCVVSIYAFLFQDLLARRKNQTYQAFINLIYMNVWGPLKTTTTRWFCDGLTLFEQKEPEGVVQCMVRLLQRVLNLFSFASLPVCPEHAWIGYNMLSICIPSWCVALQSCSSVLSDRLFVIHIRTAGHCSEIYSRMSVPLYVVQSCRHQWSSPQGSQLASLNDDVTL